MTKKEGPVPIQELIQKFLKRLLINTIIVSLLCFLLFLIYANIYEHWKLDYIKISNTFCQIVGVLLLYLDERYKTGSSKDLGKKVYKFLTWELYYYQSSTLNRDWNYIWRAIRRRNKQNSQDCKLEAQFSAKILNQTEIIQSNIEILSSFSNIRVLAYILLGIGFLLQLAVNMLEWK